MWFSSKNKQDVSEMDSLNTKITFLAQKLEIFETNLRSMRGLLNKKVGRLEDEHEEKPEKQEPSSNRDQDMAEVREAFGGSLPIELAGTYKR